MSSHEIMVHPVSRLIQIQLARKDCEPQFQMLSEKPIDKTRFEYVIECSIGVNSPSRAEPIKCIASAGTKKLAKRKAAEQMLCILGYSKSESDVKKEILLDNNLNEALSSQVKRKVKFKDEVASESNQHARNNKNCGRQLAPGLLLMPQSAIVNSQGI